MESFPDPIITPIAGSPTYESLVDIFNNINGNAASIQPNLGGGGSWIPIIDGDSHFIFHPLCHRLQAPRKSWSCFIVSFQHHQYQKIGHPIQVRQLDRPFWSTQKHMQGSETSDPYEHRQHLHASSQGKLRGIWEFMLPWGDYSPQEQQLKYYPCRPKREHLPH